MELKDKFIYTVGEVSQILSMPRDVVINLVENGYIKAIKLRGIHITKAALMEFITNYDGVDIGRELY